VRVQTHLDGAHPTDGVHDVITSTSAARRSVPVSPLWVRTQTHPIANLHQRLVDENVNIIVAAVATRRRMTAVLRFVVDTASDHTTSMVPVVLAFPELRIL